MSTSVINTSTTIRRSKKGKDNPYKMVRRATFDGCGMSFEARGALAYILMKPDTWKVQVKNLMKEGSIGRDKAYRLINEWIEHGYAERIELRDEGKFGISEIIIHEEPIDPSSLPDTGNQDTEPPFTEKPDTENQDHSNKGVVKEKGVESTSSSHKLEAPSPTKPLTDQQKKVGKICEIIGKDFNVLPVEKQKAIFQTIGILNKAGYTLEEYNRFGREVWVKDWRWIQHKSYPTLTQFREEIGKLRAKQIDEEETTVIVNWFSEPVQTGIYPS